MTLAFNRRKQREQRSGKPDDAIPVPRGFRIRAFPLDSLLPLSDPVPPGRRSRHDFEQVTQIVPIIAALVPSGQKTLFHPDQS